MPEDRPPLPPFTEETAQAKVLGAEAAWNTRDPDRVALAYTEDSVWRNRDVFVVGREEIRAFLAQKWERELDYALRTDIWAFSVIRSAGRLQYESHDATGPRGRLAGHGNGAVAESGAEATCSARTGASSRNTRRSPAYRSRSSPALAHQPTRSRGRLPHASGRSKSESPARSRSRDS